MARSRHIIKLAAIFAYSFLAGLPSSGRADDPTDRQITMAGGKLLMTAPESWKRTEPKFGIIEHEFAVPAAEGDQQEGRVTVMAALGGVEANIERWYGQFKQPDGSETREKAEQESFEAAGQKVHLIDVSGTFIDRPRPAAPGVEREDYRMLAAIVESREDGLQFVKFYGPRRTVAENAKAFHEMLRALQAR